MITIFFDGVCNLCNGFVDWLIKHDQKNIFQFASLQSEFAAKKLPADIRNSLTSVVLLDVDGKIYIESEAIIKILSYLDGYVWMGFVLKMLPRILRNFGYRLVAKYRYKIFGIRKSCRVPTGGEKSRFLF